MRHIHKKVIWLVAIGLGISCFGLTPIFQTQSNAWAKKTKKPTHKTKRRRTYRRGVMFLSKQPFPLSASSDKELIKKARRHHQSKMSWSSGTPLRFQVMLVLKRKFGARKLYLVLFKKGKKGYRDARDIPVKKKMQRLVSWISFEGSYLKRGAKYELRALKIRRRGKRRIKTVVARTTFRLK